MNHFRRTRAPQGAPPGTTTGSEDSPAPLVSLTTYNSEEYREAEYQDVAQLSDWLQPGRVTWIDVRGLGDGKLVHELGEALGLHPLAIADVVNVGQRPKVELYADFVFVVLRMVSLNGAGDFAWEQVSLVLGKGFVATFQETHEDCLKTLGDRLRTGRKTIRAGGPDLLACSVIDAIVDGYFPVLEFYSARLEELEDEILAGGRQGILEEIFATKKDLAAFRRACWPLREALSHMLRDEANWIAGSVELVLRDTLDHTMQVVEVNETYRELASSLVDMHLSMVGQRTNDIMRVLTVISAIFIPLTFVAGVYGMNFDTHSPLNLPELRWSYGYLFFWAICAVVGSCLLLIFRKLGWLRR